MAADYSKTPLVKKLGIKPGHTVYIQDPPDNYFTDILGPLPEGVVQHDMLLPNMDLIHIFTQERMLLEAAFETWKAHLAKTGMLWISWPKKAAKVPTDLNSNIIREIGLKHSLVDAKVCAIDAVWSGLKFVYRLKDRA